jgi:hypothetical protein
MNSNNPINGGSIAVNTGGSAQSSAAIVGTTKGFRADLQQLLQGIEAVVPDGSSLPVGSGNETKADMVAAITQVLAVYNTAEAQRVAIKATRIQLMETSTADRTLYTKLKDAMVAYFGKGSPLLTQFGIKPRQPRRPLTSEQNVVRAEKARMTRAARHTMGKRQKAGVQTDAKLTVSVQAETASAPKVAPVAGPTP